MLHRPGVETRVQLSNGDTVTLTAAEVLRVEYEESSRPTVVLQPSK